VYGILLKKWKNEIKLKVPKHHAHTGLACHELQRSTKKFVQHAIDI